MLTITRDLYDKIVAHARADHPDEACGVIAGPAGSDRPQRFIAMMNAERSPTFYRFDSAEQFRVWRDMDDNDEEPVVIYHSHTATEAYPSRTDISYASEPQAHYVLVSTREGDATEFRSYRIIEFCDRHGLNACSEIHLDALVASANHLQTLVIRAAPPPHCS